VTAASRQRREKLTGEGVVLKVGRHWLVPAGQILLTAPLMLVALIVALAAAHLVDPGSWLPSATWGLTVVGLWLGIPLLRWASASLTLTERRLILETGVLGRTRVAIPLDSVQSVGVRQSLPGRIFGYGTIDVWTGLAGPESFGPVPMGDLPERLLSLAVITEPRRAL
jgi:uncharacterized membrane protein YdbT with pleckstrin-like domain